MQYPSYSINNTKAPCKASARGEFEYFLNQENDLVRGPLCPFHFCTGVNVVPNFWLVIAFWTPIYVWKTALDSIYITYSGLT